MSEKKPMYAIRNEWILCRIGVIDRKLEEMNIDAETDWVRFAIEISSITNIRECDGEYEGWSTIDAYNGAQFTISVPFDDLLNIKKINI